jgi:hypothetical protein
MTETERADLIARYAAGYEAVVDALDGITDEELDAGGTDGWTARQVVHHLADSETTSYIRLRRLLAEDQPVIVGYDEEQFARRLHYHRPIAASLEVLRAVRLASAELLAELSDAEWSRAGTHSDSGGYDVETWLQIYAAHAHDHAEQIRRVRRMASKSSDQ